MVKTISFFLFDIITPRMNSRVARIHALPMFSIAKNITTHPAHDFNRVLTNRRGKTNHSTSAQPIYRFHHASTHEFIRGNTNHSTPAQPIYRFHHASTHEFIRGKSNHSTPAQPIYRFDKNYHSCHTH